MIRRNSLTGSETGTYTALFRPSANHHLRITIMLDASYYASLGLADVLDKVLAGQRLSAEDGMALFACVPNA